MTQTSEHSLAYYKKLVDDQRAIIRGKDIIIQQKNEIIQGFKRILKIDNRRVSLGEKAAWLLTKDMIAEQEPNEDGLVRVPIGELAEGLGMSTDSAARYIAKPCERFQATRQIVEYTTQAGQNSYLTFIDPTEPYWIDPETAPLPEDAQRKINGNGKCRNCGGTLKKTKRVTRFQRVHECTQCGERTIFQEETGMKVLPEGFTPGKGAQAEELSNDLDYTDLETEKGAQAEELVIDESDKLGELPLLTTPGTPQLLELSGDPEKETAQLLLAIAGDHSEHIKMKPKKKPEDPKYITIDKPLKLGNMYEHIRGNHTYGSRLYYADGTTRALRYDADSPEQWQRCKEAARLLDKAFIPILEPSPAPEDCPGYHAGGGALWIIFDHPVDSYSAKETIKKYTGSLLIDIQEVWPPETDTGNRCRLPGGVYRMKGFEARCKLYVYSEEIPVTALPEYMTPASVVEPYEKPEPEPQKEQRTNPQPQARGVLGKDLASQVIADFNASTSWESLLGKPDRRGKYEAIWRGDRTPNVSIDPRTDLAKDFSINAWLPRAMDKYQVYCFIEGRENWEEFKRSDLKERCNALREATITPAPYDPPNRNTMCCNAGWHWNGEQYECAACHGQQVRRAS